ncbi:hypothetical protein FJTKL_10632 [Diaporthe vaccinii]|uniref:Uncharacterized protein n=1 Tax=Diaporthe vaccinii TaxID=105482 RepID=A0ABR4EJE2_9PEZI
MYDHAATLLINAYWNPPLGTFTQSDSTSTRVIHQPAFSATILVAVSLWLNNLLRAPRVLRSIEISKSWIVSEVGKLNGKNVSR